MKIITTKTICIQDNQATIKNKTLEHFSGNTYTDKDSLYIYFEEKQIAIWNAFCSQERQTEALKERILTFDNITTFDKYITFLLNEAKQGGWINCAMIELARLDSNATAATLFQAREDYRARQAEKELQAKQERENKLQAELKAKNDKTQAEIKKALEQLAQAHAGQKVKIYNSELEHFDSDNFYTGKPSCIIEELIKAKGGKLPIKFLGWLREHCAYIAFENGKAVSYGYPKGHKSTSIFTHIQVLNA